MGVINDGDADRLGLADENGVFIDQLRAYGLMALYLLKVRGDRRPIVKALSTTGMLDILGQKYGAEVYEVGVGFKYVAPKMQEVGAMIGGEESGGYAFGDHLPERDGILAALLFLDFMVQTGKKPSELVEMLFEEVGNHYYYSRVDTRFPGEKRPLAKERLDAARPGADRRPARRALQRLRRLQVLHRRRRLSADPLQRHRAHRARLHRDHAPGPGAGHPGCGVGDCWAEEG